MVDYIAQLVVFVAVYGLAASGLNLVTGYGGMFSIAHGFYFALGAYGYSLLVIDAQWPITAAIGVALVLTGVIGGLVALPALRLRGDYLVIASLAIQLVGIGILTNWDGLTHGAQGIFGIPFYPVESMGLRRNVAFAVIAVLALCLALAIVRLQVKSPWGRVLVAIREDEIAAASVGKHVTRTKVESWALSAVITALGGVIYAAFVGFIDPDTFDLRVSISILTMVLIGGAGTLWGPIVGAVIVIGLPELLRPLELPENLGSQVSLLLNGLLLAVFMMFRPRGILGRRWLGIAPAPELASVRDATGLNTEELYEARLIGDPIDDAPTVGVESVELKLGGRAILEGVNLQTQRGQIMALIGPNGAGKSTLLDIITGFTKADSGRVLLRGTALGRLSPERIARKGVVRVFQEQRVFAEMTMQENVVLGYQRPGRESVFAAFDPRPSSRRENLKVESAARELLILFGLGDKLSQPAGSLSGGQQRLVGIARAVAANPAVLLLDEPCTGVSRRIVEKLKIIVRAISASGPRVVVVVEHNTEFVREVADIVVFLDRGKVMREGLPQEVFGDDELSRVYFGVAAGTGKLDNA